MVTDEMKMQRKTTRAELPKHYKEEGEEFIQRIITGDESWVHHNDPESKRQSMEYRHKSSPSPRKFNVVVFARKVVLSVFWDSEGIVLIEFLKQGNTINSEWYIPTLRKLSVRLKRESAPQSTQYCITTTPGRTQVARLKRLQKMNFVILPHPS
ncbi:histone-lysine N-methyltransferase SETMAR [Elysia marginata]|uniref:Histone-lysine N-methyltransferase SETMAR n=1 Tax=Elysia marginata TaxID=1093978 RepID=A0AAV4ESZ6_9GAST|nr:histone-lysine N-methyltransferase SETMAR [Elysia marginata]